MSRRIYCDICKGEIEDDAAEAIQLEFGNHSIQLEDSHKTCADALYTKIEGVIATFNKNRVCYCNI